MWSAYKAIPHATSAAPRLICMRVPIRLSEHTFVIKSPCYRERIVRHRSLHGPWASITLGISYERFHDNLNVSRRAAKFID